MEGNDTITVVNDTDRPGWARLVLKGRITVALAREFHRAALALAAQGDNVAIECAEAECLDAAAIQVLLCLERALLGRGMRGAVVGVTDRLGECFRFAGLGAAPSAS
jgi:anti-anti-sigma regulatory factor